jgi:RHS repeat-associated protein
MILDSLDPDTGQVARLWWSNGFFPNAPTIVSRSSMPVRIPISASTRKLLRFSAQNCNKTGTAEGSVEPDSCPGCPTQAGQPVQLWDGTMTYNERDPIPSDLGEIFTRSYASNNTHDGLFGTGWWSALDSIMFDVTGWDVTTQLVHGLNDDRALFRQSGGVWIQSWPTSLKARATLTGSTGAGFSYRGAGSSIVQLFGANHKVAGWIDLAHNRRVSVTYDGSGMPSRISDDAGAWSCTVTTSGGRVTQISVDGRPDLVWNFAYTSGRLQTVSLVNAASPWRSYEYSSGGQLTTIRDALGNAIEQHSYDSLGRATTSLGASGDITLFEYLAGQTSDVSTARITHADGGQTTFNQAFIGRDVTTHVDGGCSSCGSNDSTYSFDSDGHVLRTQDGRGYIVENTYGENGNLTDVTTALVPSDCDPVTDTNQCRLTSTALTTAPLAQTAATDTMHYDYEDPNWPDRATRTTRKSVSSVQSVVDAVTYDAVTGQTLQHVVSGLTGSDLHIETHTTTATLYFGTEGAAFEPGGPFQSAWLSLPQPVGLRKSMDGPRTDVSDVTTFVYYPIDNSVPATWRGRVAAVKNAAGHIATFSDYDVFAHPQTTTDPNGVKTETTYDALGRLATSTTKAVAGCDTGADPLCATDLVRQITYQLTVGPMQSSILPAGGTTAYGYDSRSRVASVSRGPSPSDLRERIDYTYDASTGHKSLERVSAYESGTWVEKRRESYAFDSRGRLALVTHADATSVAYTYDGANNISSVRDERHSAANTTYAYDPMNRLASVKQTLSTAPGGQIVTAYAYDIHGNLTAVTDPNGNVTSYIYDDFGRMLSQTSPVTGVTTYAYDPSGDLISTTDANAATTTRTYDALGRVLTAISSRDTDTQQVTWTYDDATAEAYGIGRLASATSDDSSTSYHYDRRGLLREEVLSIEGDAFVQSYGHDADGNRTTLAYPSGRIANYTFDFAGRPLAVAGSMSGTPTPYVTSASYLPFGPLTSLTFGNGTAETRTFDQRYSPATMQLSTAGGLLANYSYAADGAANITQINDLTDSGYNRSFGYDDLNRLVTANSGASLWGTGGYTYDSMGNMLTATLGSKSRSFTYAGAAPLISTVSADGALTNMHYDAVGNELNGPAGTSLNFISDTRTYSPRNLLQQADLTGRYCLGAQGPEGCTHWGQSTSTFWNGYDARGVRVVSMQSSFIRGLPDIKYYFYTPELMQLATFAPNDGIESDVIWFGGRPVASDSTDGPDPRFTFTDHLGTPILQTDALANVVWRAEYEPFGNVIAMRAGGANDQRLRFPGQQIAFTNFAGDEESYNIFRWYRSGWGRYTQADPIRLSGGLNLYGYASGDPVDILDPRGLKTFNWSWGGPPRSSPDPAGSCRRPGQERPKTRVSCTNFLGASLDCVCRCGGTGWEPNITLRVSLEMYVFNGPITPGMAHDQSIHGFDSAVDHELNKHVRKGVDAVKNWLDSWMKDSYSTKEGCEGDCSVASGFDPSGIFRAAFNKSASTND